MVTFVIKLNKLDARRVLDVTGLERGELERLIRRGLFPQPNIDTASAKRWWSAESVRRWMEQQRGR
jgi:predicted DNA-binding transcriptional regulator AlpA